jgi:hypothetical protein
VLPNSQIFRGLVEMRDTEAVPCLPPSVCLEDEDLRGSGWCPCSWVPSLADEAIAKEQGSAQGRLEGMRRKRGRKARRGEKVVSKLNMKEKDADSIRTAIRRPKDEL